MLTAALLLLVWIAVVQAVSNIRNELRSIEYERWRTERSAEIDAENAARLAQDKLVQDRLLETCDTIDKVMGYLSAAVLLGAVDPSGDSTEVPS